MLLPSQSGVCTYKQTGNILHRFGTDVDTYLSQYFLFPLVLDSCKKDETELRNTDKISNFFVVTVLAYIIYQVIHTPLFLLQCTNFMEPTL